MHDGGYRGCVPATPAGTAFGPRRPARRSDHGRGDAAYARGTSPPLALFDWDNTLHAGWTLEGWVDYLVAHGIVTREREAVWIERKRRYARGEIDHNQLAVEANGDYARGMTGWSLQQAAPLVQQFVAEIDHLHVYPWVAPLLHWLAGRGLRAVVISGAPQEILAEHVRHLGVHGVDIHGLTLTVDSNGRFAGGLAANDGTDGSKRALLRHLSATAGPVVLGVGDSVSDLPLLEAARRQLVVGPQSQALSDELGPTAASVGNPAGASVEEMIDLVRSMLSP